MKMSFLLVFIVSFILAFSATYAADQTLINTPQSPGTSDFNKLYFYHNRGIVWQQKASTGIAAENSQQTDVRKIQLRLKELGYDSGKVDGIWGPDTEGALKVFQREKKLTVDGVAGPITCKALFN